MLKMFQNKKRNSPVLKIQIQIPIFQTTLKSMIMKSTMINKNYPLKLFYPRK